MSQLSLFPLSEASKEIKNSLISCGLLIRDGYKNSDFVVFNPHNKELIEVEPQIHNILLRENDFNKEVKSITWSSGCRFFFIIYESFIIMGNTLNNEAIMCSNLSANIFKYFNNTFKALNKPSNGSGNKR